MLLDPLDLSFLLFKIKKSKDKNLSTVDFSCDHLLEDHFIKLSLFMLYVFICRDFVDLFLEDSYELHYAFDAAQLGLYGVNALTYFSRHYWLKNASVKYTTLLNI